MKFYQQNIAKTGVGFLGYNIDLGANARVHHITYRSVPDEDAIGWIQLAVGHRDPAANLITVPSLVIAHNNSEVNVSVNIDFSEPVEIPDGRLTWQIRAGTGGKVHEFFSTIFYDNKGGK